MFHLLKNITQTYTWPVSASIPVDGGKVTPIKFDAEFKRLSADYVRDLSDPENDARPKTDTAMVDEIMAGIKAKDEAGIYGDVSESDAAELRAVSGVERAIIMAFFASLSGEKAKN